MPIKRNKTLDTIQSMPTYPYLNGLREYCE